MPKYRVTWRRTGGEGFNPITGKPRRRATTIMDFAPPIGALGFEDVGEKYVTMGGTIELEVYRVEEIDGDNDE